MEKVQVNSIDKKQNGPKYSKNDKSYTLPQKNEIRQRNRQRSWKSTKKSPAGQSKPNQNTIIINIIL